MCYITKCAKLRGSKVDHASIRMTSLAIYNAARDSVMQLTGQNCTSFQEVCQVAIKWRMAVVYTSYSLRTGEAIKESVVRKLMELAVNECVEDGKSMAMPNELYKKQCHVWCFYSSFHISTALLIYLHKWSSFALPSRACSTCNFTLPTPNFLLIRAVCFILRV